jgi:hypothetical protein
LQRYKDENFVNEYHDLSFASSSIHAVCALVGTGKITLPLKWARDSSRIRCKSLFLSKENETFYEHSIAFHFGNNEFVSLQAESIW